MTELQRLEILKLADEINNTNPKFAASLVLLLTLSNLGAMDITRALLQRMTTETLTMRENQSKAKLN